MACWLWAAPHSSNTSSLPVAAVQPPKETTESATGEVLGNASAPPFLRRYTYGNDRWSSGHSVRRLLVSYRRTRLVGSARPQPRPRHRSGCNDGRGRWRARFGSAFARSGEPAAAALCLAVRRNDVHVYEGHASRPAKRRRTDRGARSYGREDLMRPSQLGARHLHLTRNPREDDRPATATDSLFRRMRSGPRTSNRDSHRRS